MTIRLLLFLRWLWLVVYGIWLLISLVFVDTSDWCQQKLILAKRSFAVVMAVFILASVLFAIKALGDQPRDYLDYYSLPDRVSRIENRQDIDLREHSEMKRDIAVNQSVSASTAVQLDRLIWGVLGLTTASIAQLVATLYKLKMGNTA